MKQPIPNKIRTDINDIMEQKEIDEIISQYKEQVEILKSGEYSNKTYHIIKTTKFLQSLYGNIPFHDFCVLYRNRYKVLLNEQKRTI